MNINTIGIIGGKGKMGRLFEPIFKRYAKKVLLSDMTSNEKIAKESDVLVFTVPIASTIEVIESLLPLIRKDQLLLDFTSIKEKPCEAMLKSSASVIGMHPMFGPSVQTLEGQTVVLCPVRPDEWLDWIVDLLRKEKATVIQTTPEKHDRMMAVVQCLVHFTSLLFSKTMKEEGINPEELFQYASPVYRMQLYIAGRIANQSAELYRDIQFQNPAFEKTLENMTESFETMKSTILKHDGDKFEETFKEIQDFLGPEILDEGQTMTNMFIKLMRSSC
ncbi:prephenate dehydrogenase/arogenate dehydrogenase family protein [Simkania negevensis]|uniref:Putative arogenate/prephenate dehydrogenase n=1 Tax=Simkania negevensis (strain ATCC VR-1471 / DSM 27360 / Z) TaxID=331113 RepID=F8L8F1_SIMNZ|nr:prephenate dehydrogenase/arogenate dehydrogenase family protein [Simkania negevensis]CCB89074.1 putative arogenate/prephenate dehydrogenase [Simkania negevensis Z]